MRSERRAATGPVDEQALPERTIDELGTVGVVREGGGTPLFFIADAVCEPLYIASLCAHVHVDVPVYRVTAAARAPFRTAQGLAGFLLEAIRRVQPKGPYRVVGCAVAGWLAYELALQLVAADEEVAFLGLLETNSPGDERYLSLARDYEAEPSTLITHWFGEQHPAEQPTRHAWTNMLRPQHLRLVALPAGPESLSVSAQETLGRALARTLHAVAEQRRPLTECSYAPLMTIQTGRRDAMPYFCVHGAGASVIDFIPFAGAIGEAHPVHGFQARGMDGDLQPYSTVEHAAKVYLSEIESLYPQGGVHLVGHSFGGWIAFEIAQRLLAKGRVVRSLTLLDTGVPGGGGWLGLEYTRPEALMALISLYEQAAGKSLELCQNDFEGLHSHAQLRLLHGQLVRVGLMPARSVPEHLRGTLRCFEAALRTRYCPSAKFAGQLRLVLVRGVEESPETADERMQEVAAGWSAFATTVECRREAGNHITLLKAQHIASVAGWMRSGGAVSR